MSFADEIQPIKNYLNTVAQAAGEQDCRCYLVGGSLRQLLTGRTPHELDFVLERKSAAERLAQAVSGALPGASEADRVNDLPTLEVRHENVVMQFANPVTGTIDGADSIYADISDAVKEDVLRRDFTINTLLLPVDDYDEKNIIDPTAIGLPDIFSRRLRTPVEPEITFTDDPLRMLRAVRFAVAEGFRIKADLAAAITSFAHLVKDLPGERLQQEFTRIITAEEPSRGIELMRSMMLLHYLFPSIDHLARVHQRSEYYQEDILSHTTKVLNNTPPILRIRLAALYHDVGKARTLKEEEGKTLFHGHQHVGSDQTRESLKNMRYSNKLRDDVGKLVEMHMITYSRDWSDVAVRRLVNKAGDLLDDLMLLYRADIMARTAPYNDLSEFNHLMERIKLLDLDALIDVKSPLPGEEVMSILGIAAGPEVGEAQKDIEQAIIDGKIAATESDAKAYLENEFKRKK